MHALLQILLHKFPSKFFQGFFFCKICSGIDSNFPLHISPVNYLQHYLRDSFIFFSERFPIIFQMFIRKFFQKFLRKFVQFLSLSKRFLTRVSLPKDRTHILCVCRGICSIPVSRRDIHVLQHPTRSAQNFVPDFFTDSFNISCIWINSGIFFRVSFRNPSRNYSVNFWKYLIRERSLDFFRNFSFSCV